MENNDFNRENNASDLNGNENDGVKVEFNKCDDTYNEEVKKSNNTEKKEFNLLREIREWVVSIVIAIVVVVLIKGFLFDIVKVDGQSMDPTLAHGQHLILTKLGYQPERGDIIVLDANYKKRQSVSETVSSDFDKFRLDHDYFYQKKRHLAPLRYIKRVIGLPGDKIFIDENGNVYVNDELIEENYIQGTTEPLFMEHNPYTVEEGRVFVMGDNRQHSSDSRSPMVGTIPYEAICGKASFRIWPLNEFGSPYKN